MKALLIDDNIERGYQVGKRLEELGFQTLMEDDLMAAQAHLLVNFSEFDLFICPETVRETGSEEPERNGLSFALMLTRCNPRQRVIVYENELLKNSITLSAG